MADQLSTQEAKIDKLLFEWFDTGMIMLENLNGLARAINFLVSEDKIGCECDCCRGDHARIAKRMIEVYMTGVKLTPMEKALLLDIIDWLDQRRE